MTTLTLLTALVLSTAGYAARTPITTRITETVTAVWTCQDQLGVRRTRPSVPPWKLPRSTAYRTWVYQLWIQRRSQCLNALHARAQAIRRWRTIPNTGDWQTAVRLVQRIHPGTSSWLLSCSSGEGGHGRFVFNNQGSGAGGWMQFLASTFTSYSDAAFVDARAKGFTLPAGSESWYHPLGQALTAAWMRTHGGTGHWVAGTCHT